MADKQNSSWIKWTIIIFTVVAVMVGGVWYFKRGHTDAPEYQTVAVVRGDLTQVVTATGALNPVVNVTVGSQVSGRISKLNVDFNSVVKSNEVIAEIDPSTYQAAVEQASADLANAKANLELQQVEANRSQRPVHQQIGFRLRLRHRHRHVARSRGDGEDQAGLARQCAGESQLLQNCFAGGWHSDFARGGPRPDGGVQFQHADALSNRERPDENAN
jgi:multidrug efflux pump subunit AcrA (membrane-fusion protein)